MTNNQYDRIIGEVSRITAERGRAIVAIDGRCAGGKTTLAARLADTLNATVFHIDDFFLRPEQRTAERLAEPGGNFDRERFLDEVLIPLSHGETVKYRRFDCGTGALLPAVHIDAPKVAIVEGSYSCHPKLIQYYDLRIFVDIDPEEQRRRLLAREGADKAAAFFDRWIPLEEKYFDAFNVRDACNIAVRNNSIIKKEG